MTHATLSHVQNYVITSKLCYHIKIVYNLHFVSFNFIFSTDNRSMYSMPISVSLYTSSSSILNPVNDLSFVTGNVFLIS